MKFVTYSLVIFCAYKLIEIRKYILLRSLYMFALDYNTIKWFLQTKLCCEAPNEGYLHMCEKATINNQDIRSSVTIKSSFANISWMTRWICTIKLVLESAYQTIPNNIWYIT